ncbi:Cro/CI family transcriptional regulator, partial [Photorhabdus temperata]
VSQWKNIIPERAALKLNKITNGKLKYKPALYNKAAI